MDEPDNALLHLQGLPMGKTLQMQKGFWEGCTPIWTTRPAQRVRCLRQGDARRPYEAHRLTPKHVIAEKKAANGGKNYLEWIDAVMLCGEILFYSMHRLRAFTYNTAKRRSHIRWPQIVTERLRPDGPTTRLIDLKRERGLDV